MKESCLIIGGGMGMGLGLANVFASRGFTIGFITRRKTVADEVGAVVSQKHDVAYDGYEVDIRNFKSLHKTVQNFISTHGVPSAVIYNGAGYGNADALSQDPDSFIEDLKVSVGGFLATYQSVYPLMKQRGHGSLLVTGGGIANNPSFEYLSLGVGKTALEYVVKSIAPVFARQNIHVGIVNIHGSINTGTHFSPEKIAQAFFEMHSEHSENFTFVKNYK